MRLSFSHLAGLILLAALPTVAVAQRPATAVQLPTWSSFSASTTVLVPDRGSALMGGVSRASEGRNEFGSPLSPFRNSSIGSQRSASSIRVTATIHDFEAMEKAILSESDSELTARGSAMGAPLTARSPHTGKSWLAQGNASAERVPVSVADVHAQQAGKKAAAADEAAGLLARGEKAEADGKPAVAKIYYQMVVRRGDETLQHKALTRLEVLRVRAAQGSQLVDSGH